MRMQIPQLLDEFRQKIPPRITFWVLFLLLALATGYDDVTHYQDLSTPRLIGHADQADVALVARNIAEGKGAITDAVWLHTNGGIAGGEIPAPEPYWSIYVAAIVAVFFYFLSPNLTALLIPAALTKIAVAALAAQITLRMRSEYLTAFAVAAFLLCDRHMEISVSGLSDIYLAFFMLLTCATLAFAISKDSPLLFFFVGLLIGISIGIKPSGALLTGLLLGYLLFLGDVSKAMKRLALVMAGIVIGIAPLANHNYQAFGTVYSPALALVSEADHIRYLTGNHERAFYDPEPYVFTNAEQQTLGSLENELSRFQAFSSALLEGRIFPAKLLPLVALAILLALFNVRGWFIYRHIGFEKLFDYISVQMFIAGIVLGFAVHMEPRYWLFMVPFMAIGTFSVIARVSRLLTLVAIAVILTMGMSPNTSLRSAPLPQWFVTAEAVLPEDAVVLTADPWQFAFHTRRPAVVLPYTDKPEVLLAIRDRYGADFIVILSNSLQNEFYRPIIENNLPPYLEPFYSGEDLIIVRLK